MRPLNLTPTGSRPRDVIGDKINRHIAGLNRYQKDGKQKILELCQVGKLLGYYFPNYEIIEVRECPDFIISDGIETIGLEHGFLLDSKIKAREGFFENISDKIEENLLKDDQVPNCLVNCFLDKNVNYRNRDKEFMIHTLTNVVREFVVRDVFIENEFVIRMRKMPHSQKSVNINFGGWVQKTINEQLIVDFVASKESKVSNYNKCATDRLWLVILIGNVGESSYEVDKPFKVSLNTQFDKVYLYEDFANRVYELK